MKLAAFATYTHETMKGDSATDKVEDDTQNNNEFLKDRPLPEKYRRNVRVVTNMLRARQYALCSEDPIEEAMSQGKLDATGRFGKVRVVFFDDLVHKQKSIGVDESDLLLEVTRRLNITHLILILVCEISYVALGELVDSGLHWEKFLYKELAVDITKHMWVPEHTLLTRDQVRSLLSSSEHPGSVRLCGSAGRVSQDLENVCVSGVVCFCLSRLLTSHPISRYYGYQHGDIVLVVADSSSIGVTSKYKVVMDKATLH